MAIQERLAMFRLAVVGVAIAVFATAAAQVGVWRAEPAFAVIALLGLEPVLFRRAVGACDERDRFLHLRAVQWGTGLFWAVTTAGLWTAYAAARASSHQVPVEALALVAWLEAATLLLCNAVATLAVYRLS